MNKKFQRDFFGDNYREKEAGLSGYLSKYSKHRLLPHLRVPTEYIVIAGIGMLVLVIIAYAVGVERGKRVQLARRPKEQASKAQMLANKEVTIVETTKEVISKTEKPEIKLPAKPVGSIYTIQLASFKELNAAKREAEKMKKRGFNIAFKKSGSWYLVYAEGYRSMEEAKKAKKELAKYYKDCYIRSTK
jgi:septal ring-binding cell division protein DamX